MRRLQKKHAINPFLITILLVSFISHFCILQPVAFTGPVDDVYELEFHQAFWNP